MHLKLEGTDLKMLQNSKNSHAMFSSCLKFDVDRKKYIYVLYRHACNVIKVVLRDDSSSNRCIEHNIWSYSGNNIIFFQRFKGQINHITSIILTFFLIISHLGNLWLMETIHRELMSFWNPEHIMLEERIILAT